MAGNRLSDGGELRPDGRRSRSVVRGLSSLGRLRSFYLASRPSATVTLRDLSQSVAASAIDPIADITACSKLRFHASV